MNDMELINSVMSDCKDRMTLKQMAFMLARQRNPYEADGDDELQKIISNENDKTELTTTFKGGKTQCTSHTSQSLHKQEIVIKCKYFVWCESF